MAVSATLGGLGVALGAFGAHGLQKITADEKIIHGYQTGVQYQMYHALALMAIAIIYFQFKGSLIKWAAILFITGIVLFSGSLYFITILKVQENDAVKFVGPVTPIGGILFIAGWLAILIASLKKNN